MESKQVIQPKIRTPKYLRISLFLVSVLFTLYLLSNTAFAQRSQSVVESPAAIVPTINFYYSYSTNTLQAIASDNDLDSNSWQHSAFMSSEPSDCATVAYSNQPSASNSAVSFLPSDEGHWICFKVSDMSMNTAYGKIAIALSSAQGDEEIAPATTSAEVEGEEATDEAVEMELEVDDADPQPSTHSFDEVVITTTQTEDVLSASWEATVVTTAEDDDAELTDTTEEDTTLIDYQASWAVALLQAEDECNDGVFDNNPLYSVAQTNKINGLTWRDNGNRYCFRLTLASLDASALVSDYFKVAEVSGFETPEGVAETSEEAATEEALPDEPIPEEEESTEEDQDSEVEDTTGDGDNNDSAGTTDTTGDSQDATDNTGNTTEDVQEDNTLQTVGIGIAAFGVLAIIMVVLISRRQKDDETMDVGDEDDEEEA